MLAGGIVFVATTAVSTSYLYWSFQSGRTIRAPRPFTAWLYEGALNGVMVGAVVGVAVAAAVYLLNVRDDANQVDVCARGAPDGLLHDGHSLRPRLFPRQSWPVLAVVLVVIVVVSASIAAVGVRSDDELDSKGSVVQFVVGAIYATYIAVYAAFCVSVVGIVLLLIRWTVLTRRWTDAERLNAPLSLREARTGLDGASDTQ